MIVSHGDGPGALLAFDTSGSTGSVALALDGVLVSVTSLTERAEHAARLLPAIDLVLSQCGVGPGELSGIVVGEGPGSFTGVRVAAATAKGLAMARGVPLRPASSLAAAAMEAARADLSDPCPTYVLFDARGDRVYGACYQIVGGRLEELIEPHPGHLGDVLDGALPAGVRFVGEGAEKHRALLEEAGHPVILTQAPPMLAVGLLACAALGAAPATPDPSGWEPRYVRASNAERSWTL